MGIRDKLIHVLFTLQFLLLQILFHESRYFKHLGCTNYGTEQNYRHQCQCRPLIAKNSADCKEESYAGNISEMNLIVQTHKESRLLVNDILFRLCIAASKTFLQFMCWPFSAFEIRAFWNNCKLDNINKLNSTQSACSPSEFLSAYLPPSLIQVQVLCFVTPFLLLTSEMCTFDIFIALQKNTDHLGYWRRVRPSTAHKQRNFKDWRSLIEASEHVPKGTIVKHDGKVFIAVGAQNSAIPDYNFHKVIYSLFRSPWYPIGTLLIFTLIVMSIVLWNIIHYANSYSQIFAYSVHILLMNFPAYSFAKKAMIFYKL